MRVTVINNVTENNTIGIFVSGDRRKRKKLDVVGVRKAGIVDADTAEKN